MARRIVAVVRLDLDDHPAGPVQEQRGPEQVARDLERRAVEEGADQKS